MEVYTDAQDRRVYLETPVTPSGTTMDVVLTDDRGAVLYTFTTVSHDAEGKYSVMVPYAFVGSERLMNVRWTFTYVEDGTEYTTTKQTPFSVVQPILSLDEVKSITNVTTDAEAIALERMVRHIIYAHTGQAFGLYVGVKVIKGAGSNTVQLPYRLLEISKINGIAVNMNAYTISQSGWYLTTPDYGVPNVKADYYGLHEINGMVSNPNGVSLEGFRRGWEYVIDGKWGWYEVPDSVKEAARILISDYSCQDSTYRDRYLATVSATDWQIQFNSGAFQQTGNVRADQLLSNYVLKRGWAVV